MSKFKPGDLVMLKSNKESYPIWYANYGLTPFDDFCPDMVAEVIKTDIPRVCGPNRADLVKIGFGGKEVYPWGSVSYSKELSLYESLLKLAPENSVVSTGRIDQPCMTYEHKVKSGVLY